MGHHLWKLYQVLHNTFMVLYYSLSRQIGRATVAVILMFGPTQPKSITLQNPSLKVHPFIWDQIQFTHVQRVKELPALPRKHRKHNIHKDKDEKDLFPPGENTMCCRSLVWDTCCLHFLLGLANNSWPSHLNKTSPFPGSVILFDQCVNIYKPHQDCDGVIMSQCPFSNYRACF